MFFALLALCALSTGTLLLAGVILLPYGWVILIVAMVSLYIAFRIFDEGVK